MYTHVATCTATNRTNQIFDHSRNFSSNFVGKMSNIYLFKKFVASNTSVAYGSQQNKNDQLLICHDFSFTFSPKGIAESRQDWLHSRHGAPADRICHIRETPPVHTWSSHRLVPSPRHRHTDRYLWWD